MKHVCVWGELQVRRVTGGDDDRRDPERSELRLIREPGEPYWDCPSGTARSQHPCLHVCVCICVYVHINAHTLMYVFVAQHKQPYEYRCL